MTLLPGVVMNIRPWFTIGVVSWASTRSVLSDQARDSFPMLLVVICLRGLKPEPSYVRRYISQSPASGCCSRSSVTVGYGVDPTCTPCAAMCAAGRHSHNVKYDAGWNLISCLPPSMEWSMSLGSLAPLPGDPLPDVARATQQLDAVPFMRGQEAHHREIHQCRLRQVEHEPGTVPLHFRL